MPYRSDSMMRQAEGSPAVGSRVWYWICRPAFHRIPQCASPSIFHAARDGAWQGFSVDGKNHAHNPPVSERPLPTTVRIFLLALAYFITGWLGLKLPALNSHITLLWLPTGIAVAALLRWGYGCWPGVALAAFAVNISTGLPWHVAAGIAAGNTLGPLLAAWALRRMAIHPEFDRKRDILILAAGAVPCMLVSSILGMTMLSLAGHLPDGRIAAWLTWWAGDTMGIITAAPLVLASTRKEWRSILRRRGEFLICMGATGLGVWGVFALNRGLSGGPWALAFVPLPMLAWAALRFSSTGTSLALIVLSAGAAYATATGRGPFHRPDPIESVLVLWIYMATSAVLGWLITALHFASVRATGIQQAFEVALNDVSLGMLLSGLDRRITYANHGFTQLTGYTEADMLGKSCALLHGPQTDPMTVEKLKAALQGEGNFDGEILNYRKDGTAFWNALLISPVHDEQGARTGFLGIQRDITERKRAERALFESEGRYRTLFEANPHPMWAYDLETLRFLAVNASAIAHYGYTREEFLAMTIKDIRPPEDVPALIANVAATAEGPDGAGVWRHCKRDGSVIDVEITSHDLEFDGRRARVVLAHDVTEQRRAKLEREQLDRKMQETQKLESLGVLAGGIAHDFNNILTAILGNASLATDDVPPGSPVHECLEQISQAALRAADLCKQMLAYSGRGRFVVRRLDLGQLIAETIQMLQISISKKAVLRFQLATELPPVEVDPTQIRQVIMNLVINASDAIGEKAGTIHVSTGLAHVDAAYLRIAAMPADLPMGDYAFLEVSDDGCGMSAETKARIFDPFFTTKFTGRGLGLAAVLGIVRGHKGAMKVYSEPGRGSTFKLLFPAAIGPVETAPESPANSAGWRGHGTVLVVEDEQAVRATIAPMLAAMGLEFVLANDGREGVEQFGADPGKFSLVLLDLTMPRMDGAEAFAELRKLRADVPLVLMSGFNEQEALVRFAGKGLASFIQKPFALDSLRTVIRSVIG